MNNVSTEYKKYLESTVMTAIAQSAHGNDYCGQTSSATYAEVLDMLSRTEIPDDGRILDAGCGNGCFALSLVQDYGYVVYGVDICQDIIELARTKSKSYGLDSRCQFYHQDFAAMESFHGKLDLVLCVGSLYWNPSLSQTLRSWRSSFRDKGSIVIFLNVKVSPLTEKEQTYVGKTSFIDESILIDNLTCAGFDAQIEDKTDIYIEWLQRWCAAMHHRRYELEHEMGEIPAQKIFTRFHAYLDLAITRKVKRAIVISKLMG